MNKDAVNLLVCPSGASVSIDHDDLHARVAALKIGLLPGIQADLRQTTAPRAAAGIGRDGNQMTAVIAWAGIPFAAYQWVDHGLNLADLP